MKEIEYVCRDKKNKKLSIAMNSHFFITICLLFWCLPFLALITWIWQSFSGDCFWTTKEEYYKELSKQHKGEE